MSKIADIEPLLHKYGSKADVYDSKNPYKQIKIDTCRRIYEDLDALKDINIDLDNLPDMIRREDVIRVLDYVYVNEAETHREERMINQCKNLINQIASVKIKISK